MTQSRHCFRKTWFAAIAALLSIAVASISPSATSSLIADDLNFDSQIGPLLKSRCLKCHGSNTREGGLRLLSRSDLLLTNDSGTSAIVPGDSQQSRLIQRITASNPDERMPPEGDPLTVEQIENLRRWIDEGALWSEAERPELQHWAYRVPQRPPVPTIIEPEATEIAAAADPDRIKPGKQNPIDAFIRKTLEQSPADLSPSGKEIPARLLRRVFLDLTGFPPTPEQVIAFEAEPTPERYAGIVDELLASPHYGEKWAQQWLDLARYADSNGYQADQFRSIWPYRDWVIQAMNQDMPFNQMTIEQIAGDLLPNCSESNRIATGFHRCTTCNVEAGVDPEENRVNQVADRVTTTATIWLGTTMECARCHNHKYDPFTQQDFYQLFAFFNNTPLEVEAPKDGGVQYEVAGPVLRLFQKEHDVTGTSTVKENTTAVMVEMPSRRSTHVFLRGDFLNRGPQVTAQTPSVLHPLTTNSTVHLPAGNDVNNPNAEYTRLDLAKWLVSDQNPLVARVTVNRWWAAFFGRGIVSTQEDFGTQGSAPSHPELLDWLAVEFMENKWSMKHIHRLIVMSDTYQQSSNVTEEHLAKDPYNILLSRGPRFRLSAETIRDNALAASGLLSTKMLGPPVYPPQPDGIWRHVGRNAPKYETSTNDDRFRRGIYVVWRRSAPYPSFVTFDAPDRASCVPSRSRSNTPLQALTLLNDPAYVEMAFGMARRILLDRPDASSEERLEYAFRLTCARQPRPEELTRLAGLLHAEQQRYEAAPSAAVTLIPESFRSTKLVPTEQAAWFSVCNVLLNLDETITKN